MDKAPCLVTRVLAALVATALLSSCASSPPPLDCKLEKYTQGGTDWAPFAADGGEEELNVLALSAGGEYGAYGTGFMRGWSEVASAKPLVPARITVVTGVSTGAIISTHVFLGRYAEIDELYRTISGADIYKPRGMLAVLFGNALTDSSGKDALIERNLTAAVIDQVAAEARSRPHRKLLAGAVDLRTGAFLRVDLSRLASDNSNPNRDKCYRAVVGAASAIPIAFPPVYVDKLMLVDGGLRHYSFLQNIDPMFKGPLVKRRLFAIYHGDLSAGTVEVGNSLLPIAQRVSDVALDQLLKDTAYRLDYIARFGPQDQRFETYYLDAMEASKACLPRRAQCTGKSAGSDEDMFCHPYMVCLSDAGRADGKRIAAQGTWLRELMTRNLGSNP